MALNLLGRFEQKQQTMITKSDLLQSFLQSAIALEEIGLFAVCSAPPYRGAANANGPGLKTKCKKR